MPIDRSRYPPNWDEISRAVRLAAGNRCQWCGAANHQPHPVTRSRVVLTVAHLDDNPMNNRPENLAALCQRCHLAYDAPVHAKHARETWRRKRAARRGQLALFGEHREEAAADGEMPGTRGAEALASPDSR